MTPLKPGSTYPIFNRANGFENIFSGEIQGLHVPYCRNLQGVIY
jgi:hypothetical protein